MTLRANYPPVTLHPSPITKKATLHLSPQKPPFTLHLSLLWIEEFAGLAFWGALDDEAVRVVETAAVKVVIR